MDEGWGNETLLTIYPRNKLTKRRNFDTFLDILRLNRLTADKFIILKVHFLDILSINKKDVTLDCFLNIRRLNGVFWKLFFCIYQKIKNTNLPAIYLHCNIQCGQAISGSLYFISYTLLPSIGKYLEPWWSLSSCTLINFKIFLSKQSCVAFL